MTHAIVLVEAARDAMSTLGGVMAEVDGVREVYSVTGDWDFVAIIAVRRHEDLRDVMTARIAVLPGVERTQTMVAFAVFSRHDLEAAFDLGQ